MHDDIIVWGKGKNEVEAEKDHDKNVKELLERCREKKIKLNKEKVEFKKKEIGYLGHVLGEKGITPDPKKIDAIDAFPDPQNKADLQRLLGMIGYLQKFTPQLSEKATVLRELVKDGITFRWSADHKKAFEEIKAMLKSPPVLKYFSPEGQTTLQVDSSEFGLGACLMTNGQPVQFASRALTETERNYAQIEKEMLAIVFGLERFERFCYGRAVLVESDHKPLQAIHQKNLLSAPKRLQRMLLRTQKFDYTVVYKKGTEMVLADTLSRAIPNKQTKVEARDEIFQTEFELEVEEINMTNGLAVSNETLEKLKKAALQDEEQNMLMTYIISGWPEERSRVPLLVSEYFPFRDELSTQNGLVFKGERIVVPKLCRDLIKSRLHKAHTGITACQRRAKETVYWPGMYKELEEMVHKCDSCQTYQNNQAKEPMITDDPPERAWEKVGVDIMEHEGRSYLVTVDYFSDFFEVDRLEKKDAHEIIIKLKLHFARHGSPLCLRSDNGPPFQSEKFRQFTKAWEIEHITSSPYKPRSNGKVENAVKQAKNLMKKCNKDGSDMYLALLELRNTPTETIEASQSQRLFNRRTRTILPTAKSLLEPKIPTDMHNKLLKRKEKQMQYYNKGSHELSTLKPGQVVRVRFGDKWKKATVQNQVDIRSYKLYTEDGQQYRRNRQDIRVSPQTDIRVDNNPHETLRQSSHPCETLGQNFPRETIKDKQPTELSLHTQKGSRKSASFTSQPTELNTEKDIQQSTNVSCNRTDKKADTQTSGKNHNKQTKTSVETTPMKVLEKPPDSMNESPIVNPSIVTSKGRLIKTPSYLKDYDLEK